MKNMGMKIIWTCGLLMLFLKGCFNGKLEDEYVTLLDKVEIWKGSCAVLRCEYRSKETYDKFIWLFNATYDVMNREFNGTTVYNNTEENDVDPLFAGRVQYVGKSNTDCTIVIRNIRKEDEGKYNLRLLSINKEKKWMSKTLTITVSDIGTTLKIHPLPEIKESETVTLNCSISYYCPLNNITLYWIEDVNGTSTIDAGNDTGEVQTTSTLTFRPSWRDNKKNITCVLNGDDGEANNTTIQLNVMHAPKNVQIFSNATIKIQRGRPLTLTCSVESSNPPDYSITWFRDNPPLQQSSKKGSADQLQVSNPGKYFCKAKNKFGEAKSNSVEVSVLYAPDKPVLKKYQDPIEGKDITLECSTKANPPVSRYVWFQDGNERYNHTSNQFTIYNIKENNSGSYTCLARNKLGEATSDTLDLNVMYAPDKPVLRKYQDPIEGKNITLECSTKANPPVSRYVWFQDGNDRYNHTSNQFTIYNIKENNSGSYTCLARNKLGEATSDNLDLNVMYAPDKPVLRKYQEPIEGKDITLECSTNANPPVSRYVWFQDGNERYNHTSNQFTIYNIKENNSGSYTCLARNKLGEATSDTLDLNVMYAPDKPVLKKYQDPIEGKDITLECSTKANPPVSRYVWFQDGDERYNHTSNQFTIYNIKEDNSGSYTCLARNKLGEATSDTLDLNVMYAPEKPVLKKYQDPIEGKDITLECSTNANPPVSRYVWFQDGNERYNHTSNQFTIYNIKENNSGSYTCLARNKLGEATSDNLDLNVMYAPKNVTLTVIPGDHVTEHMNVTLKCASSGNPARISYEFYVNNVSLGRDAGSFELNDVQIKDIGDYSCLATNLVGEGRSNVVFLHVSDSPATIGKFAIIGAFSFIVLLLVIIILNVRFRVRIRNALCRRTVDDKSESLFFVLKKPHESADNIGHQTPSIYSSADQLNDSRVTFPAPSKEQSNLSSAMADKDVTTVNSVTGKVPNVHKYENIDSSERAHEDSQDESHSSTIANLNEKHKERVRDPEVEYASLGHS